MVHQDPQSIGMTKLRVAARPEPPYRAGAARRHEAQSRRQGEAVVAAVFATITFFLFRMFWRATQRKRVLLRQGWFAGRRTGNHWAYDELHDGMIESIELPLDYVGRGEYDIHVPGQQDWLATMPPWARDRREEIVERLATVFKRSQMLFDADKAADSAQSPTP